MCGRGADHLDFEVVPVHRDVRHVFVEQHFEHAFKLFGFGLKALGVVRVGVR